MQRRGMAADFSWNTSARQYVELYRRALAASEISVTDTPPLFLALPVPTQRRTAGRQEEVQARGRSSTPPPQG
jgi:hypothetical protein